MVTRLLGWLRRRERDGWTVTAIPCCRGVIASKRTMTPEEIAAFRAGWDAAMLVKGQAAGANPDEATDVQ